MKHPENVVYVLISQEMRPSQIQEAFWKGKNDKRRKSVCFPDLNPDLNAAQREREGGRGERRKL